MPTDPLKLLRLQFGLDPDPTPTEEATGSPAVSIGGASVPGLDPGTLARIQNGLPPAPAIQVAADGVAPEAQVSSQVNPAPAPQGTIGQPAPVSQGASDKHVATLGTPSGQPVPEGVHEDSTEGLAPNQPLPQTVKLPPPVAPELKGSPAYQAQAKIEPQAQVPQQPPQPQLTEEQKVDLRADQAIQQVMGGPQAGLAPTPEDVSRLGLFRQDQALVGKVRSMELQAQLDVERAKQSAPSYAQYAEDANRIAKEKQAEIQRYLSDVREGFDAAKRAADEANAAYPNPDDLLGGKGSWSRAITLGLAAASAGMPGSSIGSIINQQLQLQMGGRQARFGQLKERADALALIAEDQAKAIPGISAGYDGMFTAAQQRLGAQLQVIANRMAPGQAKVNLLGAASDLMAQSGKQMMTNGKDWAETQEKMAASEKNLAEAYAKGFYKGQPLGGHGGGSGGGGAGGPTSAIDARYNALGRKDQERVVWNVDHTDFVLAKDKETATAQQGTVDAANTTMSIIDSTIAHMQSSVPSFQDKVLGKMGWSTDDLAVIRADLSLANAKIANMAVGGGKRTPLAELKAIKEALDKPGDFSSKTLDQMYRYRDDLIDEAVGTFRSTHPGFMTPDSFGRAPRIADAPTSASLSKQVVGDYVPGTKSLNSKASMEALDAYVNHFYDTDERGQQIRRDAKTGEAAKDEELLSDLKDMGDKIRTNRAKALLDKEVQKVRDYDESLKQLERKTEEVRTGAAKRAHDKASKAIADEEFKKKTAPPPRFRH